MKATFLKSAYKRNQYPPPDKPEIAFAGKSNVGKSSLINTLLNRKNLAKTSSKPGKTQAINFFSVDDTLYLVDLPGYGFARVPDRVKQSWKYMVESYLNGGRDLKALVLIMDIRREPNPGDLDLMEWLKYHGIRTLPVITKADKLSRQQALKQVHNIQETIEGMVPFEPITFSAKSGQGRDELWETLKGLTR